MAGTTFLSSNLPLVREQFPALQRPAIFFDNPAGTQIARQSAGRMQRYLLECNANHGGAFQTSRLSDAVLEEAHAAMADLLNAGGPEEIVFGNNMTSLTLHLSRSLAHRLGPGDEIVVTRLDHDANISPWLLVAEERGCKVTWIDFDVEEGTLKLEEFAKAGDLVPIDELLDLRRKHLVTDVRNLLPIWYTLPILSGLFAFLFRLTSKKRARKERLASVAEKAADAKTDRPETTSKFSDRRIEFAAAAAKVELVLLPEGYKLDEYLSVLINRWNTMLNPQAKADLTEDVNSLIRDYLRGLLRSLKPSNFTAERVKGLAATLADTPSLLKIRNHSALEEYIRLYMVRLLKTR